MSSGKPIERDQAAEDDGSIPASNPNATPATASPLCKPHSRPTTEDANRFVDLVDDPSDWHTFFDQPAELLAKEANQ